MRQFASVERKAPKTKKKDIAEAFYNGYCDGKNTNINKAIK